MLRDLAALRFEFKTHAKTSFDLHLSDVRMGSSRRCLGLVTSEV
jgi:hypothetical protein